MQAIKLTTVKFNNHDLVVSVDADQQLVAMRPICEGIGLAWSGQYDRISRDEVLSTCVRVIRTQLPNDTQTRDVVCLPLEYLNGWLFGVDVKRCREEIRPALLKYKRECYAALAAHWQKKEVKPQEQQPSLLGRRWLVTLDHEGNERIQPVPTDAFVLSINDLLNAVTVGDTLLNNAQLSQLIIDATKTLQGRMAYLQSRALR